MAARSQYGVWASERRLLTVGLIGLITAAAFEGMAVPTVLPAMVGELGGLELYGWTFSAFWLTNIVGITIAGSDADRHGPKRAFLIGLSLFAAGLVTAGLANGMFIVILGRAVQGLGSGAIASIVYVVIARAYGWRAVPRMIAFVSSAWVVPGLVGPPLAGLVADNLSWRWVFLGLVPPVVIMGAAVLMPIARLGRSVDSGAGAGRGRRALDAVGLALGSTMLLGALSGGNLLISLPLLLGGGVLTILALRRLVPPGTLRARAGLPAVVGLIFLFAFAFFGTDAFVPLAVTTVRGESTTVGGLALSAAAVSWAAGAWLPARLARRGLRRELVAGGAALIAIGIAVSALVLLPQMPIVLAATGWAVAGLGMGLGYSTLAALVLQTAEPGQEGASSAAMQLMFTLGTAFGAGTGGALVALTEVTPLSLSAGIALADGLMIVAVLLALSLSGRIPARAGGSGERHGELLASPAGALGGSRERP